MSHDDSREVVDTVTSSRGLRRRVFLAIGSSLVGARFAVAVASPVLGSAFMATASAQQNAPCPHIIYIVADDFGLDAS